MVLPLVKKCHSFNFDPFLIALTGAKRIAELSGIKSYGYLDFIDKDEKSNVYAEGKKLLQENYNPSSSVSMEESLSYLGINSIENFNRYGPNLANSLYSKVGRHAFLPINFFVKVF